MGGAPRPAERNTHTLTPSPPQVLSDPERRDIYDVYGLEGLSAGLALGEPARSKDDMRREWEAFQAKRRRERVDAQVGGRVGACVGGWGVHLSVCVCARGVGRDGRLRAHAPPPLTCAHTREPARPPTHPSR